jgi:hypothetical protein
MHYQRPISALRLSLIEHRFEQFTLNSVMLRLFFVKPTSSGAPPPGVSSRTTMSMPK